MREGGRRQRFGQQYGEHADQYESSQQPGYGEEQYRSWDENTVWDDEPVEASYDEEAHFVPDHARREVIATNRTIRLICTFASLSGLFAIFLCFAEKESRAIRRYSYQSAALSGITWMMALVLMVLGVTVGSIPLMGFVVTLLCWLMMIAFLVVVVVFRIRMMLFAWNGFAFRLPVIDVWVEKRLYTHMQ